MGDYFIINFSAGIMVIIILFIRRLFKNRIPHMVFTLLWLSIGLRTLLPVTVDTPISFYNLKVFFQEEKNIEDILDKAEEEMQIHGTDMTEPSGFYTGVNWKSLSLIGSSLLGVYFIVQYLHAKKEADRSVAFIENEWVTNKIKEQKLIFNVECKMNDKIDSPAVWGSFKPVILFPAKFDFSDKQNAEYIILHECGHIKYLHSFFKIISMLIVSLYWYNPFIWILYLYIDRDMEISSDRYVMKKMVGDQRAEYARSIVEAVRAQKQVPIFYYHYKNNFIKERIEAIMNFKKLTVGAVITALLIPAGVVSVFATTDIVLTGRELQSMDVKITAMEQDNTPISEDVYLALRWEDIENYISHNQEKAASYYNLTDYEHVTYGQIPPKTIFVTVDKSGATYEGTLTRSKYVCDDKNDKYTGYYSGRVYLR